MNVERDISVDPSRSDKSLLRRIRQKTNKAKSFDTQDQNSNNSDDVIIQEHHSKFRISFRLPRPSLKRKYPSNERYAGSDHSDSSTEGSQQATSMTPTKRKRSMSALKFLRKVTSSRKSACTTSKDKISRGSLTTEESDEDLPTISIVENKRGLPISSSPESQTRIDFKMDESEELNGLGAFGCGIGLCGVEEQTFSDVDVDVNVNNATFTMPEDPTVEESFQCIFASPLLEGLNLWDDDDDNDARGHSPSQERSVYELQSPTTLHQSRMNRSTRSIVSNTRERFQQATSLNFGAFHPLEERVIKSDTPSSCRCVRNHLPMLHPNMWPQAPLLLRPTPGSGTRIKGIRFAKQKDCIWKPGSQCSWPEVLAKKWNKPCSMPSQQCCENCAILPINNGNESTGEALVIDFETDQFEGSFLLRLRFSEGTTPEPYDDERGYFRGLNRRYQAVVRGRFKKKIPMTELVTGFQFNRPFNKLPQPWILRGAMKFLRFFSPQLDTKLDGDRPHSLSPLGSTPQSISLEKEESDFLDGLREEPKDPTRTLLGNSSLSESSLQRGKARKRDFDKLFVEKASEPVTDPSKIYTFEFLQHLVNFEDFSVELGNMLGSIKLKETLDGQPLQFMARHGEKPLWSFDIWHECLWEEALRKEELRQRGR